MSVRRASRLLAGQIYGNRNTEVVLGNTSDGTRKVTVNMPFRDKGYVCFDDPEQIGEFIGDLCVALLYLSGEDDEVENALESE